MKRKITSPTLYQISTLEEAFDLLNKTFFEKQLPRVIINQQHKKSFGYFLPGKWKVKADSSCVDEINLAPSLMRSNNREIIAELLHEMVHQWQHYFGKEPRRGYHNKQWSQKMISIGLQPDSPEGKLTGQKIIHKIINGGPFDQLINESSFQIRYYSDKAVSEKKSMIKYSCPLCGNNVWGKPGLRFSCDDCKHSFIIRNLHEAKEAKSNEIVS